MFPNRQHDPAEQARSLLGNLSAYNVKFNRIMLDIEGSSWNNYSITENEQFMASLRDTFDMYVVTRDVLMVYTGPLWATYFGPNFTMFNDTPLVYAHYDNIPSFYDYFYAPYGGWTTPSGKQFFDGQYPEIVCNFSVDWDWSPSPFWSQPPFYQYEI